MPVRPESYNGAGNRLLLLAVVSMAGPQWKMQATLLRRVALVDQKGGLNGQNQGGLPVLWRGKPLRRNSGRVACVLPRLRRKVSVGLRGPAATGMPWLMPDGTPNAIDPRGSGRRAGVLLQCIVAVAWVRYTLGWGRSGTRRRRHPAS